MNARPFCDWRPVQRWIAAWVMGTCATSVAAQDLMGAYERAKLQDAQYRAGQKALAAAMEKLPQARAALAPTVSLSANRNRQFGLASFSQADAVDRDVQSWSWNLQVTQPLLRRASWVALRQADAATRQAMAQFEGAEQDLILRVAQAYLDVLVATNEQEVAQAQRVAMDEQLSLAQRTYSVGAGTVTDVHEAKAKWAQARAQQVAAAQELESKRAELEKVLGAQVQVLEGSLHASTLAAPLESMDVWLARALQDSPQVKVQTAALEVASNEVDKSEAAHWPSLDMVLSRSTNFNSGSLSSPADMSAHVQSNQVGLQLTVPLYSGGATQSRVRESAALLLKAQDELTLAQRSATAQVRQAYSGVLNGLAQMEALQAAVDAGRNAVESNKIGLRIGTRITPDVLQAEQQLHASLRDLAKARAQAILQTLRLKAAAGALVADDLVALGRTLAQVNP